MRQNAFGGRVRPGPAGGSLSAPPDPLSAIRGYLLLRGEGKEGEREGRGKSKEGGKGRKGMGRGKRGREGEGRKGRGRKTCIPHYF